MGAALLMVPVLVAATIGFGGVGGGLTSLASGPSESAIGPSAARPDRRHSLERLSATLPEAVTASRRAKSDGSARPQPIASQGGRTHPAGGGAPSGGGAQGGAAVVGAGQGAAPPPAAPGTLPAAPDQPDVVGQILQSLLNPNSGQ
jgi:hypothetical protein